MATASLHRVTVLLIVGLFLQIPSFACSDVPACVEKWGTGRRIEVVLVTGGALLSKRPQNGAWVADSHGRLLTNTEMGRDRPFAG